MSLKPVWDITFVGNEKHVQITAERLTKIGSAEVLADAVQIEFDDPIFNIMEVGFGD